MLTHLGELLLLQARETRGLNQGGRLVGLNFSPYLRDEAGDKATKKEGGGQPRRAISKVLKVREVLGYRPGLGKLAQSS